MLNLAGTPPPIATLETDSRQLITADLRSLIARIENSMHLIDATMAREDMAREDDSAIAGSTDIFVLDDVTPRYATASAALSACRAALDHALQCLSESGSPTSIAIAAENPPQLIAPRFRASGAVPFHDRVRGDAAPGVDRRQAHCRLAEIGEADAQGREVERLRQALELDPD